MDKIDKAIIRILMNDARISYRDLGDRVCLSANAAAERVKSLVANRVIQRFGAKVNLAAIGLPLQAFVDVKLAADIGIDSFEQDLQGIRGVIGATLLTGSHDYMLRVACKDQQDLVRVMESLRAMKHVRETHSRMVLKNIEIVT
jgi:Lrp/AsnC family leucine-responsive transcriptional regulator